MNHRQRLAVGVAPLLLRVALAITFIWAGLGKVAATMPVSGQAAATLANMGVSIPNAPVLPTPTAGLDGPPDGEPMPADGFRNEPPAGGGGAAARAKPRYVASDFPEAAEVRRVYGVALRIHSAAHPGVDENGEQLRAIWPVRLAQESAPRWLAWGVVVAELGGGIALLLGVLTRIAALSIATVMAGAMWLDQIGPAVQLGQTVLGFLPDRPAFDPEAWRTPLWQFMLFMSALAVVFAGAGMFALDNVLFGRSRRVADDDDDDDDE